MVTVFFRFWNWPPGIVTHGASPVVPCGEKISQAQRNTWLTTLPSPTPLSKHPTVGCGLGSKKGLSISPAFPVVRIWWGHCFDSDSACKTGWQCVFPLVQGWDEWRRKKDNDLKQNQLNSWSYGALFWKCSYFSHKIPSKASRFPRSLICWHCCDWKWKLYLPKDDTHSTGMNDELLFVSLRASQGFSVLSLDLASLVPPKDWQMGACICNGTDGCSSLTCSLHAVLLIIFLWWLSAFQIPKIYQWRN